MVNSIENEEGQMAVELAVVLPVLLVVMVAVIDCLSFVGECAHFDNIMPQRITALAASPDMTSYGAEDRVGAVAAALRTDLPQGAQVEVNVVDAGQVFSHIVTYECSFSIPLWPLKGSGIEVLGARVPLALQHKKSFAFDPYTPGDLA